MKSIRMPLKNINTLELTRTTATKHCTHAIFATHAILLRDGKF
jgi:hypothetical protein